MAAEPGARGRLATCSASQPSLVAAMLAAIEVTGTERILEIGTGTGYNAGLLAWRLGGERVVTVEVDSGLALAARAALARVGQYPRVVCGDGADGHAPGGPYDRVLATCAVSTLPAAWTARTRPGGLVVTPHSSAYSGGVGLLRLEVQADGSARGRYVGDAPFMFLRAQQPPPGTLRDLAPNQDQGVPSRTRLDPAHLVEPAAQAVIGLQMPGVCWRRCDDPEPTGEYTFWLYDGRGSWAAADVEPGAGKHHVEQYGPRRLGDEVARAYTWWVTAGRPGRDRLGLSVEADGRQTVWLDNPGAPLGGRPAA